MVLEILLAVFVSNPWCCCWQWASKTFSSLFLHHCRIQLPFHLIKSWGFYQNPLLNTGHHFLPFGEQGLFFFAAVVPKGSLMPAASRTPLSTHSGSFPNNSSMPKQPPERGWQSPIGRLCKFCQHAAIWNVQLPAEAICGVNAWKWASLNTVPRW